MYDLCTTTRIFPPQLSVDVSESLLVTTPATGTDDDGAEHKLFRKFYHHCRRIYSLHRRLFINSKVDDKGDVQRKEIVPWYNDVIAI